MIEPIVKRHSAGERLDALLSWLRWGEIRVCKSGPSDDRSRSIVGVSVDLVEEPMHLVESRSWPHLVFDPVERDEPRIC